MKSNALIVLTVFFAVAFFGRAAVFALELSEPGSAPTAAHGAGASAEKYSGDEGVQSAALAKRKEEIAEQEQRLKVFKHHIDERIKKLEEANNALIASIKTVEQAKTNEIRKLAAIYEGMKPQQAAAIVDQMDPAFAAALMTYMNSESASQIVANMDVKKAYTISVLMAKHLTTGSAH